MYRYSEGSGYEPIGEPVTAFEAGFGDRIFWTVRRQEVMNHDTSTGQATKPGRQFYTHVTPGPLVVATRDFNRQLLVLRHERVSTNAALGCAAINLFELPGGGLDKKHGEVPPEGELPTPENMIAAANREMLQEAKYEAAGPSTTIGGFMADPYSDNFNTTVLIPNVRPMSPDSKYEVDEDESIIGEAQWVTWQDARKMRSASGLFIATANEVVAINSAPSSSAIVQAHEYLEDMGAIGTAATIIDMVSSSHLPILNGASLQ